MKSSRDQKRAYYAPKPQSKILILVLLVNCLVYFGGRLLTWHRPHTDISMGIDRQIPFLPGFVVIYLGCYLFWAWSYYFIVQESKEKAKQFALAELTGKLCCFFIFMVFPTTMPRIEIVGNDFWSRMVVFLYQVDRPDMLFPSIHCYVSWMCYLGVRHHACATARMKRLTLANVLLICASTLFVKQHVVADVFCGIALAQIFFLLFHRKKLGGNDETKANWIL